METEYLKKCFGNSLSQALAEVAKVQPNDPIEFLARWLYHYRKIALANEKNMQEQIQLKEEYENSLREKEMAAMMKQEELQIQQKCKECLSFKQEDTEPVEEGSLEQESLPDTPAMPYQIPSSELVEEIEQNLESP
uniref:DPY30 domain-containing protein 2-like n=1 Tax=Marmota marmota marmota TaxID=9994 RepID=A0A8C6A6C6_MARMA